MSTHWFHDHMVDFAAQNVQVQEALGDRIGRDIFMYSISIDPEHDTPAALKAYMEKFMVGPGWQFLTGKEADIQLLRKKLGLVDDGEPRDEHTMSLIVGNEATGQWLKRSALDNPKVMARVLGDQLFNYATPRTNSQSYAQARHIAIDPGEDLFRRRCQVCHTVGAGDTLGPDLLNVTSHRERAWLTRWLKAPDEMLAEKDPIATALYAQYQNLTMPNMRLSDHDVEVLIGYLETESKRLANPAAGADLGAQTREHTHTATSHEPKP
jgi:protein SCO1